MKVNFEFPVNIIKLISYLFIITVLDLTENNNKVPSLERQYLHDLIDKPVDFDPDFEDSFDNDNYSPIPLHNSEHPQHNDSEEIKSSLDQNLKNAQVFQTKVDYNGFSYSLQRTGKLENGIQVGYYRCAHARGTSKKEPCLGRASLKLQVSTGMTELNITQPHNVCLPHEEKIQYKNSIINVQDEQREVIQLLSMANPTFPAKALAKESMKIIAERYPGNFLLQL
jgi:hypothetical protein